MRIYVSSTSDDLKGFRAAVVKQLSELGHQVVSMDGYTADARGPVEKCLADVAKAEVYVGLFAFHYGTIPAGCDCSITEMEFREAKKRNLERLIFLVPNGAPWPVNPDDFGTEAGKQMKRLREELYAQASLGFFQNQSELNYQLERAIKNIHIQPFHDLVKPLSFEVEKRKHLPNFTGREWVEERLDNWIQRRRSSRVFCLLGGPGIGKSAIACHWCQTRLDIIGFHYCVHDYAEKIDPRRTLLSLAAQVAEHLPEYKQRLAAIDRNEMQKIVNGSPRALFEDLLLIPLSGSFPAPDGDRLIVIDGLDEATKGETNELAKVIGEVWVGLPDWLRLVVTARQEFEVSEYLSSLHPFILNASSPENMGDIRTFLRRQLTPDQATDEMINEIVAKSEGMFLYARLVLDEIGSERLTLDRIADFPQGLTGYYKEWFNRKFPDAQKYREEFHSLVSVVVAQKTRLPLEVLSNAVRLSIDELWIRLRRLGVLFPRQDEKQGNRSVTYVTVMHKSLHDWLTGKHHAKPLSLAGGFASDLKLGNHLLAEEGWRVYGKGPLERDAYFRETLLAHLAEDGQNEKLAQVLLDSYLLDSLWYNDYRVEWQRHISSLRHGLSKLVHDWLAGHDSPQTRTSADAAVAGKLCRLFQEIGAFDEAMALGEAALEIWHENNVENSPEMVDTYLAVGDIQSKREQLNNATDSHEKALEIAKRAYGSDSPQMADVLYRMNVFYSSSTKDYKKATECLDKAYDIYKLCSPPSNLIGMANCINDSAVNYERQNKSADQLALYQEALSLFEEATPRGHPEMVSTLSNVAVELLKEHNQKEALPLLGRAVAMAEDVLLPQHEYSQNARFSLCSALLLMGRDEEALEVMRQHVAENERYPGKDHVDMADARLALCRALWRAVLSGGGRQLPAPIATKFAINANSSDVPSQRQSWGCSTWPRRRVRPPKWVCMGICGRRHNVPAAAKPTRWSTTSAPVLCLLHVTVRSLSSCSRMSQ